ncbi:MAG: HYR domain-containing protein, partial [Saprospiraceae bacterium]
MSILQKATVSELMYDTSVKFLAVFLLLFISNTSYCQCATVNGSTSTVQVGLGTLSTVRIGMRFTVNNPIIVSRLGVFDSGSNGINTGITVGIVNSGGTVVVPSSGIPLTLTSGMLVGNFLMNGGFPEVTLGPGTYTVVAYGFDATDRYGNVDFGDTPAILNTGGGLITHIDDRYDFTLAMGVPVTPRPAGTYHAGNFTFRAVQPRLSTNLNGINVTTTNDGRPDTAIVVVCNELMNVTLGAFSDLSGSIPSDTVVKAYMEYSSNNVTFTGNIPVNWNFPSARKLSDYNGFKASLKKTIPNLPASATFVWRSFVDYDYNGQIGVGECVGDSIVYIVNFDSTPPVITGCPSNITLNIQRPGICDTIATWIAPTVSDLPCLGATITQTAGPVSGSVFIAGTTTTITYTAIDSSGNTSACSFTVKVNDFVNPSLGCKPV